jgi:hypothetical protein
MATRRTPADRVTAFKAELDIRDARTLIACRHRVAAGDLVGLVDACLVLMFGHVRRTRRQGEAFTWALDDANDAHVLVPLWVLKACEGLARDVLLDAPHLLGKTGRHAQPARAYADRQHDSLRAQTIEARVQAGDSLTRAYAAASAALANTPAAASPKAMAQAWRRVRDDPSRRTVTLGELETFRSPGGRSRK